MTPIPDDGEGCMSVLTIKRSSPSRWATCGTRPRVFERVRWAALALVALSATIVASCSGPSDVQQTGTQSTVTTPAVPSSASSSVMTSVTTSSTSPSTSGTPVPTGTVVPFRTVPPGSAVGQRIGLVAPNGSDSFGKAVTDSIAVQLKSAGADLITCDPGDDPNLVLDCARRLATEQVDGWIVVQPGDLGQALCDVGPKQVPLIAIAASPISCQTARVGADDVHAGFLVGKELAGVLRNMSNCAGATFIIVANSSAGNVNTQRVAGIKAGFSALCPRLAPDVRILDAGTQDRAYDAFTVALTTLPADTDILVAAVNDGAALGVVAATPDVRSARVKVAAVGADQRARCEMVANSRWFGDAALFPDRYGEVAVPALLDVLAGRKIPGDLYVQTKFVTAATVGDFYAADDCPTQ